jgi:RimJ/RimL family protein N-acetyltransferase
MSAISSQITFRHATLDDAERLFLWRNDLQTRQQSHHTSMLTHHEHSEWLVASLGNTQREIWLVELAGVSVGVIRIDIRHDHSELSWTVAPEHRGKAIGKTMLKLMLDRLAMPVRAQIKISNKGSKYMAEFAGMVLDREENGILHYHRCARYIT